MDKVIEKKKWTTKKILNIAGISIFVIFILYLLFIRDKRSKLYVDKSQITVATVLADKFQEFIPVDGVVFPRNTIYIDAVQGGIVEKVYVEDGALLKKGDTILKLSNANMELSFMEQETRIYEAINNLQNTKIGLEQNKFIRQKEIVQLEYEIDMTNRDFERKKKLYNENVISIKEFEDAKREYDFTVKQLHISLQLKKLDSVSAVNRTRQLNTTMDRMGNNLKLLRTNLENLYIKSPTDGQLSSFSAEIGETKSAGEHLGQIDMKDGFKLRANIDERYISRVFIGQDAEFDFAGKTYFLNIGKIYTDVTNGSFQVDLFFDGEEPGQIKRGQTLQLRLKFSSAQDAIIVKRGGFFQETGGNWIYIVDATEDFATKRKIRIGRQNTNFYEVMEGLEPGEKVVISSYDAFGGKDKLVFK
ncbi:MAG: HlyD family efflux transporter periplasmic adaptor subunit [Bacteroidetes bacterium]|nr:HlyD family efflux transporter periplasmic adaptor subunit [Bacteroidota bacterium]MBL7104169.1 HlyD family efflux transporter periplasmic adaptor subunit [Bacteroidales bacterium]